MICSGFSFIFYIHFNCTCIFINIFKSCNEGLICNEDITWVCFHGGFDFTYFVKLLSNENIPEKYEDFNALMKLYFPNFYDLKFMIKDFDNLKYNGLSRLADELRVI